MGYRGLAERRTDNSFDADQVRAVVEGIGISVVGETYTDLICYCPFHHNTASPAFTIGTTNGLYMCHNPTCTAHAGGNLQKLVTLQSPRTFMEALRYINKKGRETAKPLDVKLAAIQAEERWPTLPQMKIDELVQRLWSTPHALSYLLEERGFDEPTVRHFEVGYDSETDMVVTPIHDKDGNPIGVNGRSVEGKQFKLTRRIPRNKVLFNLHRAKREGSTIIVCESQFDVMRIHQAGFPNAVCFLGSHISKEQVALLQRYAERVIIMTDADKEGRKAGRTLAAMLRGTRVEWAIHEWGVIFPHGAKDAGDMTLDEIRHVINNAVTDVAYQSYKTLA